MDDCTYETDLLIARILSEDAIVEDAIFRLRSSTSHSDLQAEKPCVEEMVRQAIESNLTIGTERDDARAAPSATGRATFPKLSTSGKVQYAPYHKLTSDLKAVADYLRREKVNVLQARNTKGGWEHWLQMELALYLIKHKGPDWKVEREKQIYQNKRKRVDIWMEPVEKNESSPQHHLARVQSFDYIDLTEDFEPSAIVQTGMELKVECLARPSGWFGPGKTFPERFEEDVHKCIPGPNATKLSSRSQPCNTRLVCVGITTCKREVEERDWLTDYPGEVVNCTPVNIPDHATSTSGRNELYMIWWEKVF